MYECWALISPYTDYELEWVRGWDVGLDKESGLTAFRPEYNMEAIFYVAEEDLCYAKTPPNHCVECMCEGYHKLTCSKQYEERNND